MPSLEPGPNVVKRVSQTLIAGIFAVLPLGLTIAVVAWIARFLHDLVGPKSAFGQALRYIGMTVTGCEVTAYTIGVVGALLLVYGLGLLVEKRVGTHWNVAFDGALRKIPVVNALYDASKSLTNVFDRRQDSLQGMRPVLCYFGNDGGAAVPALMPTPEIVQFGGSEYHIVIIPSAPVPFGGALVCVKAEWIKPAACSIEEMIGVYMSMGTSAPRCLGETNSGEIQHEPAAPRVS